MRLLTHNILKNNSAAAKGKGYPLRITAATEVRVDDNNESLDADQQVAFVRSVLPTLDWSALVKVCTAPRVSTLHPIHLAYSPLTTTHHLVLTCMALVNNNHSFIHSYIISGRCGTRHFHAPCSVDGRTGSGPGFFAGAVPRSHERAPGGGHPHVPRHGPPFCGGGGNSRSGSGRGRVRARAVLEKATCILPVLFAS